MAAARGAGGASRAQTPNPAALEKRLNLRQRAREDAARDLPGVDAQSLSAAETAILDALAPERAALEAQRQAAAVGAERRLRASAPALQDFSAAALDARLTLRQVAGRLAGDWAEAAQRAAQTRSDLDAFKRANNLHRVAVYPDSGLLQAGLSLCAVLFEALFNAALFAEELGYASGAITAVGLSGANVALGFLAGYLGLRYLQPVGLALRIVGGGAFAILTLLALMLNLFAADWRDRLSAAAGADLPRQADASFHLWQLLNLDSPQAVILLMLGAGVWAFAALKGYSGFDDPYPDYGKLARAAAVAAEDLADFRTTGRQLLEEPIDAAKAVLGARLETMRGELDAMNRTFDAAAQEVSALDTRMRALDEAIAAAIHLYRQENAAARNGSAPAYFGEPPPAHGLSQDVLSGAAALIDQARAQFNQAQGEAQRALESLLEELDQASARLGSTQ